MPYTVIHTDTLASIDLRFTALSQALDDMQAALKTAQEEAEVYKALAVGIVTAHKELRDQYNELLSEHNSMLKDFSGSFD